MTEQTVAFIGAGNMASSLIGGWLLAESPDTKKSVRVADLDRQRLDDLCAAYPDKTIIPATSNRDAVQDSDMVVVAVKPDVVQTVCEDISEVIGSVPVLSVAAGVRSMDMQRWLQSSDSNDTTAVVLRCMPNTPALLGAGASGLHAGDNCNGTAKALAEELLQAVGTVVWVQQESLLDSVTAVSGSGPAYFFKLMECMTNAATDLGLDQESARTLAIETAYGAALMARQGDLPPSTLRENVTSKGGTTAAALESFDKDSLGETIGRGMQAAHDRAVAMGDDYGKS